MVMAAQEQRYRIERGRRGRERRRGEKIVRNRANTIGLSPCYLGTKCPVRRQIVPCSELLMGIEERGTTTLWGCNGESRLIGSSESKATDWRC